MSHVEQIDEERRKFVSMFSRRDLVNPVTRMSYIEKLVQFRYRERYPFGVPKNLIRFDSAKVATYRP